MENREWWISEGNFLYRGGTKFLGPFNSKDLALTVRTYVEKVNYPKTYFVSEPDLSADAESIPSQESSGGN